MFLNPTQKRLVIRLINGVFLTNRDLVHFGVTIRSGEDNLSFALFFCYSMNQVRFDHPSLLYKEITKNLRVFKDSWDQGGPISLNRVSRRLPSPVAVGFSFVSGIDGVSTNHDPSGGLSSIRTHYHHLPFFTWSLYLVLKYLTIHTVKR